MTYASRKKRIQVDRQPDGKSCVDELLLQSLAEEIKKLLPTKDHQRKQMQPLRCPACPFRVFKQRDQLRTHMQRHHTRKQQFCCSGTKQLRIVLALHDADQLLGKTKQANYITIGRVAAGFREAKSFTQVKTQSIETSACYWIQRALVL